MPSGKSLAKLSKEWEGCGLAHIRQEVWDRIEAFEKEVGTKQQREDQQREARRTRGE